jgi:hypothetical protein
MRFFGDNHKTCLDKTASNSFIGAYIIIFHLNEPENYAVTKALILALVGAEVNGLFEAK